MYRVMQLFAIMVVLAGLLIAPVFTFEETAFAIEEGTSITVEVLPSELPPEPIGGRPPRPFPEEPAEAVFKGLTSPDALVLILRSGLISATTRAARSGVFESHLTGLQPKRYTFGFYAEDRAGRSSAMVSFSLELIPGHLTRVTGIFIPPTIELGKTEVRAGESLDIFGEAPPASTIEINIIGLKPVFTVTDNDGRWLFNFNTTGLDSAYYIVKARAQSTSGLLSEFSIPLRFRLIGPPPPVKCRGADLNFDSVVDLIDFSILLYWWQSSDPGNPCADINRDGVVNIYDFSIMMYEWSA